MQAVPPTRAQVVRAAESLRALHWFVLGGILVPAALIATFGHYSLEQDFEFLVGCSCVCLVSYVVVLVSVYRCARAMGQSGLLWVLSCYFLNWLAIGAFLLTARKWLRAQGVRLTYFGFAFELPPQPISEDVSLGFSRF